MLIASLGSWFLHYTGSNDPSGPWYGFWSGFGSDLGEIAILGGLITFVRHKNCTTKGCWRLGHPDPKHGHPVCRVHSPHFPEVTK